MSTIAQPVSADRPTWELYSTCIQCGLCLNACPTYRVLGMEMDSPRGRIYQVLQVESSKLPVAESFVTHIDRCLDCRGCESACPSGVQYGRIVERARAVIEREFRRPWLQRKLRNYFFNSVLRDQRKLAGWARRLRFLQKSGLQKLARATGILKLLGLANVEKLALKFDEKFYFDELGQAFPAVGKVRGRVAFLAGCIASVAFAELNRATVRVLQQNGVDVFVPREQGCCGALHAHAGFRDQARELARNNIRVMLDGKFDAIVTNAAGCGSTMKEYSDLLEHDPEFAGRARDFAAKVKDVTEYLVQLGIKPPAKKVTGRITYQDPCHLAHGQNVRTQPREILKLLAVDFVEMQHADICCGSAGTYNVTHNELSMQILDQKMNSIKGVKPDTIVTANVGCVLQLRAGVARHNMKADVKHLIELLDEAY
ncbi:MAG TPA: heterodisulfide reductase-related iron-sulfur binding cluster [Terriglobales bacterium]|nr:heterodisulfide reductase-related iron-sulfur binding cluster [Terriglobales bacterium]